jgi:stearoyl-CoA desaturase (delta-9 desaturase)
MKKVTFNTKLHILWVITHVWFITVAIIDFSWVYLLLGYVWYLMVKGVGSEIGAHRYFTHQSFATTKAKENTMIGLQTLAGEGSLLTFVGMHRMHHAFSDTPRDPHSPHHRPWYKVLYFTETMNMPPALIKGVSKNKVIKFQHVYYWKLHVALILLGILLPVHYAYFVALPILLSIYTNGLVNILLHKWGAMNKSGRDQSRNNPVVNLILWGAGYHANHHDNPANYKFHDSHSKDPMGWVIDKFFIISPKLPH